MLPFTTTKVGPGDKTKAYVVRQNTCLKILLFSLTFLVLMLIVLTSTLYEVHLERRTKAHNAGVHRREEHQLRLQVGRLGMRLQQHMHDEVRDRSILREYRSRMFRAVGEYQNKVRDTVEEAVGANETLGFRLTKLEIDLDKELDASMRQLWSDVNDEGKRASEKLHNLTREIMEDMEVDQQEMQRFEEEYGAGSEFADDAHRGYMGGAEDELDGDVEDDDEEDMEEMRMRFMLDRMHSRLIAMPNISLPDAELKEWTELYEKAFDAMGDDQKEVDLVKLQGKITGLLKAKGVEVRDQPEGAEHDDYTPSVFEQFEAALEAARVMPYKHQLFEEYAKWHAGQLQSMKLVEHIEALYDKRVLETSLFDDWDDR